MSFFLFSFLPFSPLAMESVTQYLGFLEARGVNLTNGLTISHVQGERGITLTSAAAEEATLAKIPVVIKIIIIKDQQK